MESFLLLILGKGTKELLVPNRAKGPSSVPVHAVSVASFTLLPSHLPAGATGKVHPPCREREEEGEKFLSLYLITSNPHPRSLSRVTFLLAW